MGSGPAPRGPLQGGGAPGCSGALEGPSSLPCSLQSPDPRESAWHRSSGHPSCAWLGASGHRGTAPGPPCPPCSALGASLTENSPEAWPQATALGQSWSLETPGFAVSPSFCCSCCPEMVASRPWGLLRVTCSAACPALSPRRRPLAREQASFQLSLLKPGQMHWPLSHGLVPHSPADLASVRVLISA